MVGIAAGGVEEGVGRIGIRKAGADGAFFVHEQLAEIPPVRADAFEVHLPHAVIALGPLAGDREAAAPDDLGCGRGFPGDREFFRAGVLRAEFEWRAERVGSGGEADVHRFSEAFGNDGPHHVPRGVGCGQRLFGRAFVGVVALWGDVDHGGGGKMHLRQCGGCDGN